MASHKRRNTEGKVVGNGRIDTRRVVRGSGKVLTIMDANSRQMIIPPIAIGSRGGDPYHRDKTLDRRERREKIEALIDGTDGKVHWTADLRALHKSTPPPAPKFAVQPLGGRREKRYGQTVLIRGMFDPFTGTNLSVEEIA